MSGPKSSRYRLSAAARRRLELERQKVLEKERLNRIAESNEILSDAFNGMKIKKVLANSRTVKSLPKEDVLNHIDDLDNILLDERISLEYKIRVQDAKNKYNESFSYEYKKNYVALTVMPLIKEYREYTKLYNETSELRMEYNVLCDISGEDIKNFKLSRDIYNEISNEIARIKEIIADRDEQSYIKKCLDEVMIDMGYDVVGYRDVIKRNGTRFLNKLYSYSDGTAVNVTISNNGQIAMELCAVDDVDRLPENDETVELCKYMESFCGNYSEIERRLEAKGVIVENKVKRLPPSPEFAQILNINDYNIIKNVNRYQHREVNIKRDNYLRKE